MMKSGVKPKKFSPFNTPAPSPSFEHPSLSSQVLSLTLESWKLQAPEAKLEAASCNRCSTRRRSRHGLLPSSTVAPNHHIGLSKLIGYGARGRWSCKPTLSPFSDSTPSTPTSSPSSADPDRVFPPIQHLPPPIFVPRGDPTPTDAVTVKKLQRLPPPVPRSSTMNNKPRTSFVDLRLSHEQQASSGVCPSLDLRLNH
ncbi:hypothetical protein RIF29_30287 [Crotalaria pallida]|uniref:Uncharacterized protein n=1 Tax=Crotalaria pallida TaxID=3830 RepID=A0AAN9HY63_CROPI